MIRIFLALLVSYTLSFSKEFIVQDLNETAPVKQWVALPYVFSADSTGLTGGVVGLWTGYIQPQMTMALTVYVGEELEVQDYSSNQSSKKARTAGIFFAVTGYKPSFSERIFIDVLGSYAYYPNQRIYLDGGNDSVQNLESSDIYEYSPLQTQGYNNWAFVDFSYVLPMGESKEQVLPTIVLDRGIAVNRENVGGGVPFVSGQTTVGTEIFYSKWTVDKISQEPSLNTNGVRLYLEHDNTDYPDNPSRGYSFNLQYSQDFGLADSTQSWNALEAEYSHYFELPNYSWSRQNVLAFNAWSAYSPSWQKGEKLNPQNTNPVLDKHQTPMWEGARLGGWDRLRAYDSNRFNDKAAIYGAIEYRIIPEFNPMRGQAWNPFKIDWFQTVLFAEAGRVHSSYNLGELLNDMKYDVGFSLRALAAKVPVRFEMAFGEEGSSMWVMVKQPF
jgi:hypothetical protein